MKNKKHIFILDGFYKKFISSLIQGILNEISSIF